MDNKSAFSNRLSAALNHAGCPVKFKGRFTEIATALDVTPRTVGNWANGDKLPSMDNVISLAKLLGVSAEWLLTGQGVMIAEDAPTEEELDYLKALRALPTADKEKVFQLTRIFTHQYVTPPHNSINVSSENIENPARRWVDHPGDQHQRRLFSDATHPRRRIDDREKGNGD